MNLYPLFARIRVYDKVFIMNKIIYIFLIIIIPFFVYPQESNLVPKSDHKKNLQADLQIFSEIESGIKEGNVTRISKYFGQQTYFSLSNGINGYYSSNQAFYVLEDFFNLYRVTSFKIDHTKNDKNTSYATGVYNYDNKGKRSTSQVYISLKKIGNYWNITQLTIN